MSGRLVTNRVLTEPLELDPVFAARNGNGAKPCDLVTDVTDSKGAGPTDPSPLSSLVTESVAAKAATLLDDVEAFLARFIAYPSEAERIAHTLWIAHTHRMAEWDSTPRIAFLSPEPGSGKSRALEVTELLVPRPIHAVNATPAGLFRKVSDEAGPPTILFDEVDTVFGPRAKDNEDVRGMLNAGHRRGATALRCKVVGKAVLTEELPAYCAVALAGLNDLPDTIRSRAVIVRMRKRTSTERIEPFRRRLSEAEGNSLRDRLEAWSTAVPLGDWPPMPAEIVDRDADVWEALLAVADLAGGDWPDRARVTAVTFVTHLAGSQAETIGVRLLTDLRSIFADDVVLFTDVVLKRLASIEESPWGDWNGRAVDARWLSQHLRKYGVGPRSVRIGDRAAKGYSRADLADPWMRYVPGGVSAEDGSHGSQGSQADERQAV